MKYFLILTFSLFVNLAYTSEENLVPHVIMVQPIIVQNDAGQNPSSMELPKELVNEAYRRANISFVFFEPIFYNSTDAQDGKINLDQIVDDAHQKNLIRGNGDIINMFFVNKVDGKSGPLGRGLFQGNITFITLGNTSERNNNPSKLADQKYMEAFVIAHEVGHNLGLKHAIDDPNVPDSLPNIQGEGSYQDRINPKYSLNDYQIKQIHKSPLVTRKIDFLSIERGRIGIIDESFEPYFSLLQDREIYAFTKEWSNGKTIEETRQFARNKFQSAVTTFSARETACIQYVISCIDSIFTKNNINLFKNHPWRFIKIENWLCGSFAHTRGTYTILSQRYLDKYAHNFGPNMTSEERNSLIRELGGLLIHEQLHSLQRTCPSSFKDLYQNYWSFQEVKVSHNLNELTENQLLNPDAPDADWVYREGKKIYWIRVLLKRESKNPVMGKDFTSIVYEVDEINGQYHVRTNKNGDPISLPLSKLKKYLKSFPVSRGIDHPNEISAYMYSEYFMSIAADKIPFNSVDKSAKKNTELFLNWIINNEN